MTIHNGSLSHFASSTEQLESRLGEAQKIETHLRGQLQSAQEEVEGLVQRSADHENLLSEANRCAEELQDDLGQAQQENSKLRQSIELIKDDNRRLEARQSDSEHAIRRSEQQRQIEQNKAREFKQEAESAQQQLESAKEIESEWKSSLAIQKRLSNENSKLEKQVIALQRELSQSANATTVLQKTVDSQARKIANLEKIATQIESLQSLFATANDSLNAPTNRETEAAPSSRQGESKLKELVQQQREDLKRAEKEKANAIKEANALRQKSQRSEKRIEKLKETLVKANQQTLAHREELREVKKSKTKQRSTPSKPRSTTAKKRTSQKVRKENGCGETKVQTQVSKEDREAKQEINRIE